MPPPPPQPSFCARSLFCILLAVDRSIQVQYCLILRENHEEDMRRFPPSAFLTILMNAKYSGSNVVRSRRRTHESRNTCGTVGHFPHYCSRELPGGEGLTYDVTKRRSGEYGVRKA